MNNIIKDAAEQQRQLPREIMAHRVSSEHHRHRHMVLGALATVLTTMVGTSVFTGLVSYFGLDGKGQSHSPIESPFVHGGMMWLFFAVLLLSISAPIVAAWHTFLHDADDASTHKASAVGYAEVLRRLTSFVARHETPSPTPEGEKEAIREYDDIMKQYNSVLEGSITLTKHAYKSADKLLANRSK